MSERFYSVDDYERELAKRWGIPEGLVRAMTTQESGRNDAAVGLDTGKGRGRARGRYQLLESTAREMGVKDINDPFENVYGGLKYLKQGYEKAKPHFQDEASRWGAALTHYHAGPGGLDQAIKTGEVPESPDATKMTTRGHVRKIMNAWGGSDAPAEPRAFAGAQAQASASTSRVQAPAQPQPQRPISPVKGPVRGTQAQRPTTDWWELAKQQQQQPTPSAPGTVQKPAPPMPTENPEVVRERAAYERMGVFEKALYNLSRGFEAGQSAWSKALGSSVGTSLGAPPAGLTATGGPARQRQAEVESDARFREQAAQRAQVTEQAAPGYIAQVGRAIGQIGADVPYYAAGGAAGQALGGGATAATKLGQLGLAALRGLPAAGAVAARQGKEGWQERPLESALETVTSAAIPEIGARLAGPFGRAGQRLLGAHGRVAGQVGGAALGGGLTEAAQELAVSIPTRGLNPETVNEALVAAGAGAILGASGGIGAGRRTPRAADPKAQEIVDAVRPQAEAEPEVQAPAQRPVQPTRQSPVAPQQEGAVPTAPPVPAALTPPEAPKVPRGLRFVYGTESTDAIAKDNWGNYPIQVPNENGDLEMVLVGWDKGIHGERPSKVVQEEAQQAATAYAQARRAEAAAAAQAAMVPPRAAPVAPEVGVEPAQQVAPQATLDALRDALVRRPARAPNTPPMTPLPVTEGVAPQGLVDVPVAPEVDVESDIEPEIAPEPVTTYLPPTDPIRQMVATVAEQTGLEGRPLYQAVLKQMEVAPDDATATSIFKAVFRREVAPQERTIPTVEPTLTIEAPAQDAAAQVPGQKKKMSEPRTPEDLARIEEYFERPETPAEERNRIADLIDAPTGKAEVPADMLRSGRPEFDLTPPPPSRVKGDTGAYAEALHHRQKTIDDAGYDADLPAFSDSPRVKKALSLDEKASKKQVQTRLRQAIAAYKQIPIEDYSLSTASREDFENFAKRNDLGPGTIEWQSLQAALNTGQAKIDAARAKTAEKQARLDAELSRKADAAARQEQARREREAKKGKPKTAEEDLTLYGFVTRHGGIKPSKANKGEARWLSESGNKRRMFSQKSKYSLDDMRQMAVEAGFGEYETEADFITALGDADKVRSTARSQSAIDDQLEREWQEYVNSKIDDEDVNLAANRPVTELPVAGLAEKRGNVWGTERVDLANTPAEQAVVNVQENAQAEYRARPNRQGVLWGNHQASLMLYGALRDMGIDVVPFDGARLTVRTARRAADMLLESEVPAARELGDALVNAAQDAAARGSRSVVFVDSTAPNKAGQTSMRRTIGLLRHEFFHAGVRDADAQMTMGVRWAEDPDAPRISRALRQAGYKNDVALLEEESIAHVVEGSWRELGFDNEQQAVNYLKRAFKRLIQANGLDRFERMTMRVGPVAGKVAKDAKTEASAEASAQPLGVDQGIAGPAAAGRPGGAVQQPQGGIRQGNAVGRVQEGGRDAGSSVQAAVGNQEPNRRQARAVAALERTPAPVYFSALRRFVDNLPDGKVNAAQLLAQLDKPQSGVKQDELKWTGLKQWLTENAGKPITKQQVVEFVQQNQVEVDTVELGDAPAIGDQRALKDREDKARKAAEDALETYWREQGWTVLAGDMAQRMVDDFAGGRQPVGEVVSDPQAQRALEQYRRASRAMAAARGRLDAAEYSQWKTPGEDYHELVFTLPAIEGPKPKHFQDVGGNQVAHGRAQEIDVDGKRVYNVVEVQSDWHQAAIEKDPETGERRGYRDVSALAEAEQAFNDAMRRDREATTRLSEMQEQAEKEGRALYTDQEWAEVRAMREQQEEARAAQVAIRRKKAELERGVLPAPFQKTWPELVIKRMLRIAAENDFDSLAWDAGRVQADRFSLGTVATKIEYYPEGQEMYAYDRDGTPYTYTIPSPKDLPAYIGAENAKRLLETEQVGGAHILEQGSFDVGGEGMKKFYDEILVNSVNKYVKQWGAKVYPIERKLPDGKTHKMWAIDITPQMRDSVVYEGQPLFKTAAKVLNPDGTEREVMLAAAGPGPNVAANLAQQANRPLPVQPPLPGMKPASKARWDDYVNTIQTAAQLLNPRFALRNFIGHGALASLETPTHAMAAVLDAVYSKVTGEPRQIAQLGAKEAKAFGRGAVVTGVQQSIQAKSRGLSWGGEKLVDPPAALKPLGDALWAINQLPDDMMFHGYYAAALANLGKIYQGKRLKGVTPEMLHNQALAEANKAALRDKNFISNRLGQLKRALNKGSTGLFLENPKWGLGDLVVKYTQIPGALLKRGIEYTPLGFFEAAREFGALDFAFKTKKKGDPFRRRNTFLALSRAFNGSAGIAVAVVLGYAGALMPEDEEGKEQSELNREQGIQPYSLNISAASRFLSRIQADGIDGAWRAGVHKPQDGDLMVSIDWLQPWGMLAGIGGNIGAALQDISEAKASQAAKNVGSVLMSSVDGVMSAMSDQSVLKNLSRYLTNERASFGQALLYTVQDLPSSFTPQILNQLRQTIDPTVQDPRVRGEGVKGWLKEMFITKPLSRAVPGALPPKLDTFGNPIKRPTDEMRDAGAGRVVNSFVKPYVTTRFRTNPISQAMRQADKVAGAPRFQADSEKGPGETPAQWRERTQVKGQLLEKAGNAMAESYAYKQAPAEIQKRMTEVFLKRLSGGGSLHPGSIHSEARSQSLKEAREKVLGISSPQETLKQQKRMLNRFQ